MPTPYPPSYDDDFFAWTQDQALALRSLKPEIVGNAVDIAHIAEEIEDLGKRDVREVESYLRQLLVHLLKLAALPDARERTHWIAEAEEFQARAAETFKPSMGGVLDLARAWALARRSAATVVAEMGRTRSDTPADCPLGLDTLVSPEFDLHAAIASVADEHARKTGR
jgi:hypothetical protein